MLIRYNERRGRRSFQVGSSMIETRKCSKSTCRKEFTPTDQHQRVCDNCQKVKCRQCNKEFQSHSGKGFVCGKCKDKNEEKARKAREARRK